jgi:Protein of unknown function (DUF2939)
MHRAITKMLAALAVALPVGCATTQRIDAAGDVHALLVSIRDNDRAAFNAHVDRGALEAEIQAQIVAQTRTADIADTWKGLGVVLSGPLSRAAGAALIQPEVFRGIAEYYGYRRDMPIPGALALSTVLRSLPGGRVCATRGKAAPCLATFADEAGTWRLVNVDASMLETRARR